MPPVRLARRMFAGSEVAFFDSLRIGIPAVCRSEIMSVDRRQGSRGDLILVRVSDEIGQNGSVCIKTVLLARRFVQHQRFGTGMLARTQHFFIHTE